MTHPLARTIVVTAQFHPRARTIIFHLSLLRRALYSHILGFNGQRLADLSGCADLVNNVLA
eukprot:4117914-Lingulodinium_polyedra.AAC.1